MAKRDETRARILRSAVEVMGREGPEGFTASVLAREVGVSKSTLFHHFESLDEIPLAAFEEVVLAGMTRVEDGNSSLEEYLDALFGEMHGMVEEERFLTAYFAFVFKGMFDPRLRQRMADGSREMHRAMTTALAHRLPTGANANAIAVLVEAVMDGLALQEVVMGNHEDLTTAWAYFVTLLTNPPPAPASPPPTP